MRNLRARGYHGGSGRSRRAAFTLIEILIVIAIIAAVAALVLPGLVMRAGASSQDDVTDLVDAAIAQATVRSAQSGTAAAIVFRPISESRIEVVVSDVTFGSDSASVGAPASGSGGGAGTFDPPVAMAESGELVGVLRVLALNTGSAGEVFSGGSGSGVPTTIAFIAPDGSVHPSGRASIRISAGGELHTVGVDGFGNVHLEKSGAMPDSASTGAAQSERSGELGETSPGISEESESQ